MKLNASIAEGKHELQLNEHNGRVSVTLDDRQYEVVVGELPSGGLLLLNGTDSYECLVNNRAGHRDIFEVHLRGVTYEIRIEDPKRLRSGEAGGGHDHGEAKISAAMPGKVVRVMVELGQQVKAGDGIVVVEAMKMQNEMKSPKAGTVVSLSAAGGATVNAGDVLAVIE